MRGLSLPLAVLAAALPAALLRGADAPVVHGTDEYYGRTPERLAPYRGDKRPPYRRIFTDPPVFRGGGRDKPEPKGLKAVRIGLVAPLRGTRDDREGLSFRDGVDLALEEANAEGGYRGALPFELVVKNDADAWGSASNTFAEMAYKHRVWAILGSIDSDSTHVGIRAGLKAELLTVTVGSNDPTITETGIPWIMRVTPDDRQVGYRLALHVFEERKLASVAILRSSDRYGRFGVKEFRDAARRLGHPVPAEVLVDPGEEDLENALDRVTASDPEAVVLWMRAGDAARAARRMRARRMRQLILGTDRIANAEFIRLAGQAAEGVVSVSWMDAGREAGKWRGFLKRFKDRYGTEPDAFAAYGYDAAGILLRGIRSAGLNRARILDAVTGLASYDGVTGRIEFDTVFQNVTPPVIAEVRGGRFVFQ